MQTSTLFQLLPIALFWAFSPVIISVVILLLASKRPIRNTLAFTLPTIAGCMLVGIILLWVVQGKDYSANSTASDLTYLAQVICGLIFFLILFLIWWKLPAGKEGMKMPKWVTYLDEITPRTALVYGGILFLNNVFLTITAVVNMLPAQRSLTEDIIGIIVFVLVGTLGLWVPLSYKIVAPESSIPRFESMRDWLIMHNKQVLILEFGILGVLQLIQGLRGLIH